MAETLNVCEVVYNMDGSTWDGDGVQALVMKAPTSAHGGAIRIVDAYFVNGAATGAGTAFSIRLQNRGTAGTATATNISAALGGTGDVFVAGTPKQFSITDPVLEAGEWLGIIKNETSSSDPTRAVLVVHYLMGV